MPIIVPRLYDLLSGDGDKSSSQDPLAPANNPAIEGLWRGERESDLSDYRYRTIDYIRERLDWEPWSGDEAHPGQVQVIEAYEKALHQLHEKDDWEKGIVATADLRYWTPGEIIKSHIRIEAGHTVGKTKLASGLVNHFFDTCTPCIVYTFAPSWTQIHDLLWKEIKTDRRGATRRRQPLPGRTLDLRLEVHDSHFATGKVADDSGGTGTERTHGQHAPYQLFVLDEAEGMPSWVWDAIDSMASGGIAIIVMLANPRTRQSRFHKEAGSSNTKSFRMSCVWHPNVLAGREVVPGAVKRDYVLAMLEKHAQAVEAHEPEEHTFDLPFDVVLDGIPYSQGTIFQPDAELMFRVLGVAPSNVSDRTLIPVGIYEAAVAREVPDPIRADPTRIRIGLDAARFGLDYGTGYSEHAGEVRRFAQFAKQDTTEYVQATKREALRIKELQPLAMSLHIRVDGGGGFGAGPIDGLRMDDDLLRAFPDFIVMEVHFNAATTDPAAYYDLATEMYAETRESLKGLKVLSPPPSLEEDLTGRVYHWRNVKGRSVKKLEDKADFRRRAKPPRSPDDGDGFCLCAAPDHVFAAYNTRSAFAEAARVIEAASSSQFAGTVGSSDRW